MGCVWFEIRGVCDAGPAGEAFPICAAKRAPRRVDPATPTAYRGNRENRDMASSEDTDTDSLLSTSTLSRSTFDDDDSVLASNLGKLAPFDFRHLARSAATAE